MDSVKEISVKVFRNNGGLDTHSYLHVFYVFLLKVVQRHLLHWNASCIKAVLNGFSFRLYSFFRVCRSHDIRSTERRYPVLQEGNTVKKGALGTSWVFSGLQCGKYHQRHLANKKSELHRVWVWTWEAVPWKPWEKHLALMDVSPQTAVYKDSSVFFTYHR